MLSGLIALFVLLVKGIIGLIVLIFWLWMLVHAITNKGLSDGERIVWVIVIIFLPFLGALLYFFIGKPKGRAAVG